MGVLVFGQLFVYYITNGVVGEGTRVLKAGYCHRPVVWKRSPQVVRSVPVVQQVRGSLGTHEQGLIITTSDFSKGAREEAARPNAVPVGLMDGEQLVRLLVENNIGVQRTSYELIDWGDDDQAGHTPSSR